MSIRTYSRHNFLSRLHRLFVASRHDAPVKPRGERRRPCAEPLEARIAPAGLYTFTKSVTVVGNPGATSASAGDTLHYTVNFGNTSGATVSNASFQDFLDSNTTLVAGSAHISPIALDDSFTTVGNTLLEAGGVTPSGSIAVTDANNLLANDLTYNVTGGNDSFSIVSHTAPAHGTLPVFNTNGSFSYLPTAGFTGTDTFTYTFKNTSDTVDNLTDTATVTITVANKVWYIDNNASSNGDGRSSSPFNSTGNFTAVNDGAAGHPGTGDIVYLAASGTNYGGGATLLGTQTLVGAGDALVAGAFTLKAAGTAPTLLNAAGNALTLASGNTIHGFNIGATSGIGITGSSIGTLTVDHIAINTGTGAALSLSSGTFAGTGFTSTTGKSVSLTTIAGTVNLGSGALSSTTSDAFFVSGGTADINYSGTITEGASGTGHSVNIASKTAGTVTLSGAINDGGTGLLLSTNTGATIHFTGGITASTGINKAFSATGGGTIDVTGANNTLATSTATALEVLNTTISATGLTFKSISAGTTTSGPVRGISLDTTGALGGLTVTGTGSAGTGGTLQHATHGVYANSTRNLSLSWMSIINDGLNQTVAGSASTAGGDLITGNNLGAVANVTLFNDTNVTLTSDVITGSSQMGINGNAVNGLTITNSTITGNGNESFEDGILLQNASGTVSITGTNVRDNRARELQIADGSGTMTLNASNSQFGHTVAGTGTAETQQGILLQLYGTSNTTINATTLTISNNDGVGFTANGFQLNADNGGPIVNGSITASAFDNNAAHVLVNAAGTSAVTFDTKNNLTMTKAALQSINYTVLGGSTAITANLTGTISGNVINDSALPNANADAIDINSGSTWAGQMHIKVDSNNIQGVSGGIIATLDGSTAGGTTPRVDLRVTNNSLSNPVATSAAEAIKLNAAVTSAHPNLVVGWDVGGAGVQNTISGHWANGASEASIFLRNRFTGVSSIILPGYAGGAADDAAVQTYLAGRNNIAAPGGVGVTTLATHSNTNPYTNGTVTTPLLFMPAGGTVTPTVPVTAPGTIPVTPATPPPVNVPATGGGTTLSVPAPSSGSGTLTQADLALLVNAAITRWEATGLTPAQDALLHHVTYSLSSLDGLMLGQATPGHITLDADAAGNGWYVDKTPLSDSEFAHPTGQVATRVDALTTVMHELGHELGLSDDYRAQSSTDVMSGYLTLGTRHLPSAHEAVGATPMQGGFADSLLAPVTATISTLPTGKTLTIVYNATVNAGPFAAGANNLVNNASVSSTSTGTLTASATIPLNAAPDLAITSYADGVTTVVPGGAVTYNIGYNNVGNQNATGVVLTEALPAGATFNAGGSTAGWTQVGATQNYTLTIGALAAGGFAGSATFQYTISNPAPAGVSTLPSSVAIADDGTNGTDTNAANNSANDTDTLNASVDLGLTKSPNVSTVPTGGGIQYTLTYANSGNQNTTATVLTETLPTGTSFDSAHSDAGWTTSNGTTYTETIGNVSGGGAGGTAIFAVTVTAASGSINNTASINSSATETNTGNNTAVAAPVSVVNATLSATLTGGSLTIADTDATGKVNNLNAVISGSNLVITDAAEQFISAPAGGTLSNGGKTLTLPFAQVTGNLAFNTAGGADTLTLDLSGGNLIPTGGIDYNGGNPTTSPGDKLVISGGAQGTVTYTHTNATDGNIAMSTFGTVRYTGLEPIVNSGTATDVIFNLPSTNNVVTLGDNGTTTTDGMLRLSSSPTTFEQVDFAIPSNSLTLNLGAGTDTLTLGTTPQITAGLTITGGSGDDTINLNGAITFAANKNLSIDLQTGNPSPGADSIVMSSAGNYVLSGTGAAIFKVSKNIQLGGHLATANGDITLEANQQAVATTGNFIGVNVLGTSVVENTGAGHIHVLATGGNDSGGLQYGFRTNTGALVQGGTTGNAVTITGTGGASSGNGIFIPNGAVRSLGGDILFTGLGTGTGTGVTIQNSGVVAPGLNGNVIIDATTATPTSSTAAFNLFTVATNPTGAFTTGTGTITIIADSVSIGTTNAFSFLSADPATGTVTIRPHTAGTAINLGSTGGPTAGLLELSDAELDRVVASTLQIGNSNSGAITITDVISPNAYQTLSIGKATAFTSTGGFAAAVTSATVYQSMMVAGAVSIDPAATLTVTAVGAYTPTAADSFTIINNTSAGTTAGTFSGKPEGATVTVGGFNTTITYIGGPGANDVILQGTTVAVTLGTASVLESSVSGLVYTFTRSGPTTSALPVSFTTTGTASGSDYTATSSSGTFNFAAGTVSIPAGQSSVTITLTPVDDRMVEGNETAVLTVTSASGYGVSGSPASGTITDNDTATLSFTVGSSTALESAGTQNISTTLTINAIGTGTIGLASNLTADLTITGGTATGGGTDFSLPGSPAVTFLAGTYATGTATQNAAVTITDDRLVEGTETAQFGLSIVQNIGTQVSIGGTTAHTLTITDNDTATLGFTLGTSSALESVGTQNISTTLTINAIGTGTIGLASNLTANLTTTGGTATGSGTDYTLPGSPAVTFLAGTYATGTATQNAAVTVTDDRQVEGDETAQLGLSIVGNIGTQVSLGGTTAHTLTINDNDTATLGFTIGSSTALESAGTQNISTTLTINAIGTGTIGLASNLTANLTTTGGTATGGGTDYTLPGSPAVTFLAGTYATGTATQLAAVTVTDDRLVEGDETTQLGLSIVSNIGTQVSLGGTTAHTLTITDNDTATLGFTLGTSTALESVGTQNVSTTLTINAIGTGTIGLASNLTANLTTTGGTATGSGTDYTLPGSPAVTFLAGTYATGTGTQNAAVTVTDDRLVEGTETAQFGLSITGNIGTQVSIGGTTAHTLTITDNDTATLSFTLGTSTALESVGTQNIGTTLTINAIGTGTIGLASNLTANLTTTGGTATGGGTDYTLPGSPAVTFLAGTYATGTATQNAAVTVTDDRQVEGDETAQLGLSIVGNIGTQVSVGGTTAHTLTITDNDTATLGFTVGTSTALESVGTQNISTTLTINAIGTGTIGLASNLTANLTTTGGTATGGGTDYTLPGSPAVTFLAGTYATGTATQNAAVSVTDDRLVEGTETAQFGLSIVGNIGTQVSLGGTTAHTLTITDNDTATLGFTLGTSTALESVGTQNISTTLTINAIGTGPIGLASNLTADLTTTGGTATGGGTDYTLPGSPAFTFLAGTYATGTGTQNAAVAITDDRLVEGDETAQFGLSITGNIGTQVSLGGTTAHTLTITDNDTATLSFTTGSSTALESVGTQNVSTTLTINAIGTGSIGLASNLTANLTTTGGTATGGGTDYTLPGSPAVTFLAGTYATGTATQNAAVTITDDRMVEGSETAQFGLSIAGNIGTQVSLGGTTAHTLTITDNDTATLSFTLGASTALESVGTQNIGTTLTINAIGTGTIGLASNLTADLTATGGTATGGGTDYALPGSPAVTFLAGTYATGTATQNAAVTVTDDRLVEGTETAQFGLSIAGNIGTQVSVGGTTAHTLTITDNDTATLGFTVGTSTALESVGTQNVSTTLTINAIGTGPIGLASNLTANLTTTGGTATGGGTDYTLPGSPAVTFLAGTYATGTTTQNAAVAITDDRLVEGDETAQFGLSIVGNIGAQVSLGGTTAHTLTITDNDTATLSFTAGTSTALESVGTQNVSTTLTINAIGTGPIGLASNLTANLTTTGGTATGGGTDYTLPGSPAVTFLAGTYATGTATQNAAVTITDDRLVEGDETAQFGLSIAANIGTQVSVGGTTAHTLTITDNDTATLSFTAGTSTALESVGTQNVGVTLTINAIGTGPIGLASNLTADLTSTGGTATGGGTDYSLPGSPAVTFLAGTYATGTATQNAAVTITDDRLVEGTETAQFGLSIAGNIGTQVSVGGTTAHTLTITDNDTATLSFAAGTSTALESDGTHNIGVILTINATGTGPIGLASDFTADLTATGGTATGGGTDYTLPGSPAVTFSAGTYATGTATQNATVAITDDRLVEGTETASLGLSIVGNIGTQVSLGGTTAHTLTITDNDTATIGFATPSSSVTEGTPSDPLGLVLTISATGTGPTALAHDVTFNVTTTGGTATGGGVDYTLPGQVTFSAGALSGDVKTANLAITDDQIAEDVETANLGLSIATDGTGGQVTIATDATASHVTSITDNDIDLKVTGAGPTGPVVAGSGAENLSYTFTVQNNGFIDATHVSLNELFTLPSGVSFSSSSPSTGTFDGAQWNIPTLAKSATATLTINFTADHSTANSAGVAATATVASADQSLVHTSDDADTESATVIRHADLAISISDAPDPVGPTQDLTYTIVVANQGPSDNTTATIADMFPAALSNVTWTAAFTGDGTGNTSGTGNLSEMVSLPLNGTVTYTVHGTVPASSANSHLSDTATVSSSEDIVPANNSATTDTFVGGVDLAVTKDDGLTTVTPGQTLTYTLTYTNHGYVTATGVTLGETVPANTVFDATHSTVGWSLADGAAAGTAATFSLGSLPVSAPGTVTFAVKVLPTIAAGQDMVTNTATITDDGMNGTDITVSDNTGIHTDNLNAAPDLKITATQDITYEVAQGGVVHYTLNSSNIGNQDATGVTLTEHLPANSTFNAGQSSSGWVHTTGDAYQLTLGNLASGASAPTEVFAVTVNHPFPAAAKSLSESASIADDGQNGMDPNSANDSASLTTPVYKGIYATSTGITNPKTGPVGTVNVYDVNTGLQLLSFQPYGPKYHDSVRIATGDFNGDGFDDIVTSTRIGTGQVKVFNGLTGAPLAGFTTINPFNGHSQQGAYVATGDVTGDGIADIVVGSALGHGSVKIYNGLTEALVTTYSPFGAHFNGGIRVAVTPAHGDTVGNVVAVTDYGAGLVKEFQGTSGTHTLLSFAAGGRGYKGGLSVAVGDVNSDGISDIIVGSNVGHAFVDIFNGSTGALIGAPIQPFGPKGVPSGARVAATDITGDGIADIIVAAGAANGSQVQIYDGATDTLIQAFKAFPARPDIAIFVAATTEVYAPLGKRPT